jgi:hypothetical protein
MVEYEYATNTNTNTESLPSLSDTKKRACDNEESPTQENVLNQECIGKFMDFVVELELEEEVEVSVS